MVRCSYGLLLACVFAGCAPDEKKIGHSPLDTLDGSGDSGDETAETGGEMCPPCELPAEACDQGSMDPLLALGAGCDDRPVVESGIFANPTAFDSVASVGGGNVFTPREGDRFAVIGTGRVEDLLNPAFDCAAGSFLGPEYDISTTFPEPLDMKAVEGDCFDDPSLVGMGDCSKTLEWQFEQGMYAHDYSELRFKAVVPDDANAIKFDFAVLTSEYPDFVGTEFNDMFVGWLESEIWTGNVSFDAEGSPISVNAGFFNLKDDGNDLPAFQGTCMVGHGATSWLTSSAQVVPGETMELVLAVFDMSDQLYDTYVLLDNFRWGCDGCAGPETMPNETGMGSESDSGGASGSGSGGSTGEPP